MTKAVRFDQFGDIDVLDVRDVDRPAPEAGEVLVEVRAAGINPGEAAIRKGLMRDIFPTTFPSGQGSDLAGVVAETGRASTNSPQAMKFWASPRIGRATPNWSSYRR